MLCNTQNDILNCHCSFLPHSLCCILCNISISSSYWICVYHNNFTSSSSSIHHCLSNLFWLVGALLSVVKRALHSFDYLELTSARNCTSSIPSPLSILPVCLFLCVCTCSLFLFFWSCFCEMFVILYCPNSPGIFFTLLQCQWCNQSNTAMSW